MTSRINMMGVELEGGFTSVRYQTYQRKGLWHHDGSVNCKLVSGEVVSQPHTDVNELCRWIVANYPEDVNNTCGFHVHLSTKTIADYERLMCRAFHRYFLKKWGQWGRKNNADQTFWFRYFGKTLSGVGKNYCERKFANPFSQVDNEGDRYHHLNFCYGKHGTLENRMLPMFKDKYLAVKAVKYYADFVDKWLINKPRVTPLSLGEEVTVEEEDDIESEVERICV